MGSPGPAVLGLLHTPKINPSPFCLHGPEWFGSPAKDPARSRARRSWTALPPARNPPGTGSPPRTAPVCFRAHSATPPRPSCRSLCPSSGRLCTSLFPSVAGPPLVPVLLLWSVPSSLPSGGDSEPPSRSRKPPTPLSFWAGTRRRCSLRPGFPPCSAPSHPLAMWGTRDQFWPMRWGEFAARNPGRCSWRTLGLLVAACDRRLPAVQSKGHVGRTETWDT